MIPLLISAALVTMTPDYSGVTVPPNIAPLNFDLDRKSEVVLAGPGGKTLKARGREIRFSIDEWRDFLATCRGGEYVITVNPYDESASFVATNTVSVDAIDGYLTYRLIPPSYGDFDEMGIYQRHLESFDEWPIYRNVQFDRKQCVNCHTYKQGDPDTFVFHRRIAGSGTVIDHPKYGFSLHQIKPDCGYQGNAVYPAWHPSGDFIAFSVNETRQAFYLADPQKIEVADQQGDLILYSIADRQTISVESELQVFECYPVWSPDGRILYTSRAIVDFEVDTTNAIRRSTLTLSNAERIRYDIVARTFDAKTRTFSEPRVILDSRSLGASFLYPKVSPDGRWMVVTACAFGVFPLLHNESDLYLVDLREGRLLEIPNLSAPGPEAYHGFSSDGQWLVFSSRRLDGHYTRPFIAHFDAATGSFARPFLLPVENPVEHRRRLLSYNVPEFSTGPVKRSPRELRLVK